jgi:putative acetyltransferase
VGTKPEPVVRPARPEDARSFLDGWRVVVAEKRFIRTEEAGRSVRYYRKQFRKSWTKADASIVAVDDGRVIGHLGVGREEGHATEHVASLGMWVAPEWRGRGIGSALLAAAIGWAREMGVEKLALSVYPHNDAALGLYRKFGFVQEGRLTGHSKKSIGYVDEIVMGLWLESRGGYGGE